MTPVEDAVLTIALTLAYCAIGSLIYVLSRVIRAKLRARRTVRE